MKSALVALGGNAIRRAGESGEFATQMRNIGITSSVIADLVQQGYRIAVTHGNGPQIGELLMQNEIASGSIPPLPVDACVAETQGLIGFMLVQGLQNEFAGRGMEMGAVCIITRAVVGEDDDAFSHPSKPVGDYYPAPESERLASGKGWKMVLDGARGGYRRVLPSPEPLAIVEGDVIGRLFRDGGEILVISGGGGIPVVRRGGGYEGVEAVIDKDLAAQVVASQLGVDHLFMLTDVDAAYTSFGEKGQRALRRESAASMRRLMEKGEFGSGSMLPKVEAAARFVECGGKSAVITTQEKLTGAISGAEGTTVVA